MQHRGRGGPFRGGRSRPHRPPYRHQFADSRPAPMHLDDPRSTDRELKLVTNAYNILTANKDFIIHEYELLIEPSPTCKDLPPKVLARAYVSRSLRQLIMTDLIPNLIGEHPSSGGIVIGPVLEAIYSTQPLLYRNVNQARTSRTVSHDRDEFRYTNINVFTDLISHLRVDIVIKFNRTFNINPSSYSGSLQSAIMHHQLMMQMPKYGSVYYPLNDYSRQTLDRLDLISRHLMGLSISGARKTIENQLLVVINCSHSYITHSYSLINLLASFLAERPVEESQSHQFLRNIPQLASIQGNEDWFVSFCSILNGYKCRAAHPSGYGVNLRFDLTNEPASELYINETTTLIDYYGRMGVRINYPNLPCLKSRSIDHPYHPMEACNLLPGQKVPIFRLSTAARNHLIVMHKPNPNVTNSASFKARDEVVTINKAQFRAFGVQLSRNPVETIGRALKKPSLQYKNQMIDPVRDYWESGMFYQSIDLVDNWCVIDTVGLAGGDVLTSFLMQFSEYSQKFGLQIGPPYRHFKPKQEILDQRNSIESLIDMCSRATRKDLRFVLFVIDSTSTQLNRMIHLAFDDHPRVTATCVRSDSVLNQRQRRSIYRTLVHKLNARLGGTNHVYNNETLEQLSIDPSELMVVGLDVTHPDNELNGVSIVGCAYTYCKDLFRHKSLVWPQAARKEIITKMDSLVDRLLNEYSKENAGKLPKQIIIYRDGVSNEEFERVRVLEIAKAQQVIEATCKTTKQTKPNLSYIIAQKRHSMRFFQKSHSGGVQNPPGGTLIDHGVVTQDEREFYLYSNTSPQATARPLHYHVLLNGLGLENLQKLTYYLCFNFGKCSSSLSMPSSLRYAHNAAYDARNRVIASKEFSENKFYTTKFFC